MLESERLINWQNMGLHLFMSNNYASFKFWFYGKIYKKALGLNINQVISWSTNTRDQLIKYLYSTEYLFLYLPSENM